MREEEKKVAATDDVSDIERKLSDGDDPYLILIGEFRSIGPLSMHVIMRGDNKGKSSKKQTWENIHSGNKFVWHYSFFVPPGNLQKTNLGKLLGKY